MTFKDLMSRIQLSPSRKLTYFEKYRKFIDKEKLFLEEMVRISYNLGMQDVTKEHIENHKRLFPEPKEIFRGEQSETRIRNRVKRDDDLTGLKSEKGKSNGRNNNLRNSKTRKS